MGRQAPRVSAQFQGVRVCLCVCASACVQIRVQQCTHMPECACVTCECHVHTCACVLHCAYVCVCVLSMCDPSVGRLGASPATFPQPRAVCSDAGRAGYGRLPGVAESEVTQARSRPGQPCSPTISPSAQLGCGLVSVGPLSPEWNPSPCPLELPFPLLLAGQSHMGDLSWAGEDSKLPSSSCHGDSHQLPHWEVGPPCPQAGDSGEGDF